MTTRETSESVLEIRLAVWIADAGTNKNPPDIELLRVAATDHVLPYTVFACIWVAAREHVRSWFAEEILHSLGEEESECQAKTQSHPTS
jgi:hypothetical protein